MNYGLTFTIRNFIPVTLYRSAQPNDRGIVVKHFDGNIGYFLWVRRKRSRFDVLNSFFFVAVSPIGIYEDNVIRF